MGAATLLISDLAGPMMKPEAQLLLAAPRGRSGSEFQTPTIPFAIVNAILMTIAGRHQDPIMGRLEKLADEMGEEVAAPRSPLQKLRDAFN